MVLGILYLWGCRPLNFGSLTQPMEGFIPRVFGSLFLAGTIALMIQECFRPEENGTSLPIEEIRKVTTLIGILFSFVILLPYLGFSLSTLGLILAAGRLMGNGWRTSVLLALGVVALCYPIFILWLKIPLPSWAFH